jgi:hypoxanthine phosphoribosyltransferase
MTLEPLFSADEIREAVRRIASEIRRDLADQHPLLVGLLNGSFVFVSDLVRELNMPLQVDFVRARSYGSGTESSGQVEIVKDLEIDARGRHVVLVDDIADTGLTMRVLVDHVRSAGPASVRQCALLVREGCREPDYAGFRIGPGFVVGYGIDHAEEHRQLPDIRVVRPSHE